MVSIKEVITGIHIINTIWPKASVISNASLDETVDYKEAFNLIIISINSQQKSKNNIVWSKYFRSLYFACLEEEQHISSMKVTESMYRAISLQFKGHILKKYELRFEGPQLQMNQFAIEGPHCLRTDISLKGHVKKKQVFGVQTSAVLSTILAYITPSWAYARFWFWSDLQQLYVMLYLSSFAQWSYLIGKQQFK